jgi:hypothetical protein
VRDEDCRWVINNVVALSLETFGRRRAGRLPDPFTAQLRKFLKGEEFRHRYPNKMHKGIIVCPHIRGPVETCAMYVYHANLAMLIVQ